jgi:hypothetical protein
MTTQLARVWYRPALILFSEAAPVVSDGNTGTYNIGNPYTDYISLSEESENIDF